MYRLLLIIPVLLCMACSSSSSTVEQSGDVGSSPTQPIVLSLASQVGERVRTERELIVTEFVSGQKLKVSESESYLTGVLDVDVAGNPTRVQRHFERSLRRIKFAGQEEAEEVNPREGCEFELTQLADGVSIRLLSGEAEPEDYRNLLIIGFDDGLVPRSTLFKGQSWEVDLNENPYFRNLLQLVGLSAPRNTLRAQLFDVSEGVARISLRWKAAGTLENGQPIVFELNGELHVNMQQQLVSKVSLAGGKTDSEGTPLQQISIQIQREQVSGWYR